MNIQSIVNNGYRFLIESTYKSISDGNLIAPNGEPYTYEMFENIRRFYEQQEKFEKCRKIVILRDTTFGHDINYVKLLS